MLVETKLGLAAAGTGLATIGAYEWAPHTEFFHHNEAILHDGQIGLLIATTILALTTAGVRYHRSMTSEGELEDSTGYFYKPSVKSVQREVNRIKSDRRRTWLRRFGF
jgi:hypothetical protein